MKLKSSRKFQLIWAIALLAIAVQLTSCGAVSGPQDPTDVAGSPPATGDPSGAAGGSDIASTTATASSVTGNWWGPFSNDHIGNAYLWGPLVVSSGAMSQTYLGFDTNECFFQGKITSGTISGSTIKVNIHLIDGFSSTAYMKLSGTVSSSSAMSGSFTVGNTFCSFAPSTGAWKMNRVAKVSGTWSGWTKKSGSSTTHSLTLALSQKSNVGSLSTFNSYVTGSPTRMNSSVFQVTGQFGSSGSGCVSAAAVAASGVLAGGIGGLQINFGTNESSGIRFFGDLTGTGATRITGTYKLASGSCKGETGTFSLSRM